MLLETFGKKKKMRIIILWRHLFYYSMTQKKGTKVKKKDIGTLNERNTQTHTERHIND